MSKITRQRTWRPLCQADTCHSPARTSGYCPRHYQQIRRWGRLTPEKERPWERA